ncbi:MAG: DM13 domain-containing protein [Pseudomonadota bacterium]
MKNAVVAVVVIAGFAAGWFFVSPLFIDEAVDEPLTFVLEDGSFDMDSVMSMPEDKRTAMKDDIMAATAGMADRSTAETMPPETPRLVATGSFIDADAIHKGEGTAKLYALPDERHIVRFEDFRTTNGPALYVYLAKHPNPKTAADVEDGGYVSLGELKGNVGNQNYEVPPEVDVGDYGSVVIWCQLFGVLFSPAALTAA